MSARAYIQIFIGDHLRDTRILTLETKGAYTELMLNMAISDTVGVITGDITDFGRLLGENINTTERVLAELVSRNIFKKEPAAGGKIKLTYPKMIDDELKRSQKAAAGKIGMKNRYQKQKPVTPSVITDDITNQQQNTGIGNGINTGNDNEGKEGPGEREPEANLEWLNRATDISILTLPDCLAAFMYAAAASTGREQICVAQPSLLLEHPTRIDIDRIEVWGKVFNRIRAQALEVSRPLGQYSAHFINWIRKQDISINPEKIFDNANTNGTQQPNSTGANGSRNTASAAILQPGKGAWD